MLLAEKISEFNVKLGLLDYIEIVVGVIVVIMILIGFLNFLKKYDETKNKYFFWIALNFLGFLIATICRLILVFYIGKPPLNEPYTGAALIIEYILVISMSIGLFSVYFYLESDPIKNTHYIFSMLTIVTCILNLIALTQRVLLYIALFCMAITALLLPIIFLSLAKKSDGIVKKKAIIIALGFIFLIGALMFDGTEISFYQPYFGEFSIFLVHFAAKIYLLISFSFLILGFQRKE